MKRKGFTLIRRPDVKRYSFSMQASLHAQLVEEADKQKVSISQIVEDMVKAGLSKREELCVAGLST